MLAGSHRNAWPDETGTGGRTNRNTQMLIFSANPSSISIQENVSWLSEKLNIKYDSNKWHVESFDTLSANGESTVFWIAGIEIK